MSDQCYNWNGKLWKGLAPKSPFGSACGKKTCTVCPDTITETVGNGQNAKESSGLESCHPGGIIPTKWDYIKSRGGECGGQGNWSSRNRALGCGLDKAAKPLSCSIAQGATSRNDRLRCLSIDSNSCPKIDGFQPNPKWTKSGYPDCNGGECTSCDQIYNTNRNKVDCTYRPLTTLKRLKDHETEFPQDKKGNRAKALDEFCQNVVEASQADKSVYGNDFDCRRRGASRNFRCSVYKSTGVAGEMCRKALRYQVPR